MKHFSGTWVWALLLVLILFPSCVMAESSILDMEITGPSVYVEWQSTEDALLTVEIVEDGQRQPYASKNILVSGEKQHGEEIITFEEIPEYFSIEAYFSPVSGGTGGEGMGTVFVEDLYTKPVQQLIRSDGSEYKEEYDERYVEFFIDENGVKSFGVLNDMYTVMRTSDLAGTVTIEETDTDNNGVPEQIAITTSKAGENSAWLNKLENLAAGEAAYLCIVDDKGRELLDYRKLADGEKPAENSFIDVHMVCLGSAEKIENGLLLGATNPPEPKQRNNQSFVEKILEHFHILRLESTWDVKNKKFSGEGYALDFDIKGSVSIQSIFSSARRLEIDNDFNFRKIELDGGKVSETVELAYVDLCFMDVGNCYSLNFLLEFDGGQHVSASMSGNIKHTFNLKGQNGGTRIDHVQFDTANSDGSSAPQTMTLRMGPELEMYASLAMADATIVGDAYTTVKLVQGQPSDGIVWHACGNNCVEGFPETQQKLRLVSRFKYFIGSKVIFDQTLGQSTPKKATEFYHSEKFGTSGDGLCPYKGYLTTVKVLDGHNQPVELVSCSYTPVRPELLEKSFSDEGVLYIPASETPVTVQATYLTPGGVERTLSQQIVKTEEASEVVFTLDKDEFWLIYDNDGMQVSNMPEAVVCQQDDIFMISEQIPALAGRVFAGWSFKPQTDPSRQVDYKPGDPFWMSDHLFGESNTVTLYPVWEGDCYLFYKLKPEDEGKVQYMPFPEVNAKYISPLIPQKGENDYFVGWMDTKSTIPNLPLMPNPYYPETGTLTAMFVNTDMLYPTVTFDAGVHDEAYVLNMPESVEAVIGVPFKLPAEIPFLLELDFWSVDIPQFFVGWSLFEDAKIPTFFPGMDFVALQDTTLYAVWVDRPDFYLLSYNANGGSGAPRTRLNAKNISTTVPTRPDHEFKGWVKKADLKEDKTPVENAVIYQPGDPNPFYEEEKNDDGEMVHVYRSGTLYAVWEESERVYTVAFDANGGFGAPESVTAIKNTAVTIPTQLPKAPADQQDAQFAGWGSSQTNPAAVYQPGDSYTGSENVTLYAVWKQNEITVYYDVNGGDASSAPASQTFTADEKDKLLSDITPVYDGYCFEGWGLTADAQYAQYQPGDCYDGTQSIVLYAVWTANELETGIITYDANGGEHAPEAQYVAFGQTAVLSEQIPIRENYLFMGWSADAQAEQASYQPGEECLFASNVTLYAVWKLDEKQSISITYSANGGEPDSVPEQQIFDVEESNKILSDKVPVRSGYTFEGWSTDPQADAPQYQPGDCYTGTQSIELHAVWSAKAAQNCKITYDANNGTNAPQPQTASVGEQVRLSLEAPVRDNYIFMGWATATDAAEDEYQPGDAYTCTGDITLYAVWSRDAYKIYTVHYDANGADESRMPADESAFKGEMITLSEYIPTMLHFNFVGWALESNAAEPDFQPGALFTANEDTTLYALWSINPSSIYRVYYHANGGSGAPEMQIGFVGDAVTLSTEIPIRNQATFLGWAMSPTAEQAEFEPGQACFVNGTITLYAVWSMDESQECTISYDASGGDESSVPAAQNVFAGEKVRIPDQKPTRAKHVFLGWALTKDAEAAQFDMGETFVCTESQTLYAVWAEDNTKKYTLSYHANGGSGAPDAQMAFDDTRIQLSQQEPRWEGCAFLGWATEPAAEEAQFKPNDVFPAETVQPPYVSSVLYAVWENDPDQIYTVSYDANGGIDAPAAQTESNTEKIILSGETPVWREYTFLGWATDPAAEAADYEPNDEFPQGEAATPYTDTTLYAVWDKTPWFYTVSYDANGGQGAPQAQYCIAGDDILLPEVQPEWEAHVFLGWATDPEEPSVLYQPGEAFTAEADTTLYAVWASEEEEQVCTVTYDANGGTNAPQPQAGFAGDTIQLTTLEPLCENHAFLGWELEDVRYQPGDSFELTQDVTLCAVWEGDSALTYTVSYDANGADVEIPASQTELRNTPIQLSRMIPLHLKWRFMGWSLQKDSMQVEYTGGDTFPHDGVYEDTVLYAVWDKDEDGIYTITYDANGGKGAPQPQSAFVSLTLILSDKVPVREGYNFLGWATDPDAAAAQYQRRGIFPGASDSEMNNIALYTDTTLYAVWQAKSEIHYTVTYNTNGGSGTFEPQMALLGSTVTLHDQKPTLEKKIFMGWALDADASQATLQPGETCQFMQDTVLYAVWEWQRYTISYDANGGKNAPAPQSALLDTAIILHDDSHNPTRNNYIFLGWAKSPLAVKADYKPSESYTGKANATLYAVWTVDQDKVYTVTYHANGGDASSVPQPQTAVHGETIVLSMQRPVHPQRTFGGWARSQNSTAVEFQPGQYYSENRSLDLWAVWTTQPRTILFDDNGGSGGPGSQSFLGETVTITAQIPQLPGYRFEGWSLSAQQPQTVAALPQTAFVWPEGNTDIQLTLYAVWTYDPSLLPDLPQTGDSEAVLLWIALMLFSGSAILCLSRKQRKC